MRREVRSRFQRLFSFLFSFSLSDLVGSLSSLSLTSSYPQRCGTTCTSCSKLGRGAAHRIAGLSAAYEDLGVGGRGGAKIRHIREHVRTS